MLMLYAHYFVDLKEYLHTCTHAHVSGRCISKIVYLRENSVVGLVKGFRNRLPSIHKCRDSFRVECSTLRQAMNKPPGGSEREIA